MEDAGKPRQDEELEVNVFHTSAVLSACSSSKQWQLALDLLQCQSVNEVGLSASLVYGLQNADLCINPSCPEDSMPFLIPAKRPGTWT